MYNPAVLYKYREWKNPLHSKILLDNSIYIPSPNEFEDKYDCNLEYKIPTREEIIMKIESKGYSYEDAFSYSVNSPLRSNEFISRIKKDWHQELGILSLTENSCNPEMWSKYADSNRGFCIAFDTSKLVSLFAMGKKVEYGDLPIVDPIRDDINVQIEKEYFHKSKAYEFESEYRFIKRIPNYEDRYLELPWGTIVGVKLGKDMPDDDKQEIRKILFEKKISEIIDNHGNQL